MMEVVLAAYLAWIILMIYAFYGPTARGGGEQGCAVPLIWIMLPVVVFLVVMAGMVVAGTIASVIASDPGSPLFFLIALLVFVSTVAVGGNLSRWLFIRLRKSLNGDGGRRRDRGR